MKTKLSVRPLGLIAGAVAFVAGCAYDPPSHVVSAPPPPPPGSAPVVYSAPVYTAPVATTTVAVPAPVGASSIVVMQAPPAAQQEIPTARPSSNHSYVAGYWRWWNNRYEWTAGHWEVPPRAGAVWIPPRWQPEGANWRFYEGYWD